MLRIVDYAELSGEDRAALTRRSAVPDRAVRASAGEICEDVRRRGDVALREASERFGGGRPGSIRVGQHEMKQALESLPDELVQALQTSIDNVRAYHRLQHPTGFSIETVPGVRITRKWTPLRRVGAYVPGGKAAYPSTLIMTAVPARLAGVKSVVVATPADESGQISPALLGAAALVGVDELYAMGGAQAVAALAYGTATVDRVDKIVGPGNAWVTGAKLAVFGECAIDLPAGPSEVLVLADETADPRVVAVDLLCQAEHGPDSPAVLVTTDRNLPTAVADQIAALLPGLERRTILDKALTDHGMAVVVSDVDAAIDFANAYAPEHATVLTENAEVDADRIHAAGSVYVGHWSPESAGDYATGANHVLPTGGLPKAYGPLSIEDFGSWRQEQLLNRQGLEALEPTIACLAGAEGLTAHRLAASIRLENRP